MGESMVMDYKVLTDKIAEKYGVTDRIMFCEERIFRYRLQEFDRELGQNALQWLSTVVENNRDSIDALIFQVNMINQEQRRRFSNNCRPSKYLLIPVVSIASLN